MTERQPLGIDFWTSFHEFVQQELGFEFDIFQCDVELSGLDFLRDGGIVITNDINFFQRSGDQNLENT